MKKDQAPEHFKHLFDTPIYTRSFRPPGHRKYTIVDIRHLPEQGQNTMVTLIMKKNGNRKGTLFTQIFACEISDGEYKLHSIKPVWATNLTDFFLMLENNGMLAFSGIKTQKQYLYELSCNKKKYPEHWL